MTRQEPDFAAARRAMIDSQLRPQGVNDPSLLAAMASVPREEFLPETLRPLAYSDRPLSLDGGRVMMPPAALARLLAEAAPKAGETALVVAPATGYAVSLLESLGLAVETADSPNSAGKGPYDLILIDGAVEEVPDLLSGRLAPGGRLVTGISDSGVTRLAIGRYAGGAIGLRRFADAEVPLLPAFARPRAFTF